MMSIELIEQVLLRVMCDGVPEKIVGIIKAFYLCMSAQVYVRDSFEIRTGGCQINRRLWHCKCYETSYGDLPIFEAISQPEYLL